MGQKWRDLYDRIPPERRAEIEAQVEAALSRVSTGPKYIACGETNGGGFEVEDGPGPFCGDCWERLGDHFCDPSLSRVSAGEPSALERLQAENARLRAAMWNVVNAYGDCGWAKSDMCRYLRTVLTTDLRTSQGSAHSTGEK